MWTDEDYEKWRLAGKAAGHARDLGASLLRPGVSALEVVEKIEWEIYDSGAKPAFPATLSINDVAAHYTPRPDDDLVIPYGAVVKVDVGAHVDGFVGDTAKTVEVGTRNWAELIRASEHALSNALDILKPQLPLHMVGATIERTITSYGYRPISNLTGHTVDRWTVHAGKSVPNVEDDNNHTLDIGEVVAVEPFSTNGLGRVENASGGNIFRVLGERPTDNEKADQLQTFLKQEFNGLPFAERWCLRVDRKAGASLQKLWRLGLVMHYPALRDGKGGIVAQTEHTAIVQENGVEVITE